MSDEPERSAQSGKGQLGEAEVSGLGAAALMLSASVLGSRVIGYFREVALAHEVGVGSETDAFYTAFLIPDVLNYLLAGGALAIAFIPLYNRVRRREGQEEGDSLLSVVLGTLGCITVIATCALWITAEQLTNYFFPAFSPETRELTVRLTRIVLPAQIFFLTGGLLRAVLMAHGRFFAQASAPLIYNGAIIAGGVFTGTVEGFAWGVLAGAFVGNWIVPGVEILRFRKIRVRFAPFHRHFLAYLHLALPLMVGVSLVTVDEWYEKFFGAAMAAGTVAQLGFARKLMMAPVSVVGQAVAAAALPVLSRLHAEGRSDDMNRSLLSTLRASLSLAILAGAACFVLAEPIVEVVYRYGKFGADDALRVASLLAVLSLAVPGWVTQQIAVRAFYAREEMWRPMLLGSAIAVLAIPLYHYCGMRFGAEGLAEAGVIAISVNALATLFWSRRRFGAPALGSLFGSAMRALVIAIAGAIVARFLLGDDVGRMAAWRDLGLGGGGFVTTVVLATLVIGDRDLKARLFVRFGFGKTPEDSDPAG